MVTAETAVVLPVLVGVLVVAVWVLACVTAQLRCVDAARVGARAAARGEDTVAVIATTSAVAPAGAEISVSRDGDEVTVLVRAVVRAPGAVLGRLPGTPVAAEATALTEERAP
jgi:Flp pilus assembly protein TadG